MRSVSDCCLGFANTELERCFAFHAQMSPLIGFIIVLVLLLQMIVEKYKRCFSRIKPLTTPIQSKVETCM